MIEELMAGWPASLQLTLSKYVLDNRLEPASLLRVDLVLALLRIGSPEALERAQELTGRSITKCPSAVPPWPPLQPVKRPRGPVLVKVAKNDHPTMTPMHGRYSQVRLGMTKEQLLSRGCTSRDINYWQKTNRIEFGKATP